MSPPCEAEFHEPLSESMHRLKAGEEYALNKELRPKGHLMFDDVGIDF